MEAAAESTLDSWAVQKQSRRCRARSEKRGIGLRFTFYGRTSTEDYQDRSSSEYWQRDVAENVIFGRGVVVAEFFDSGYSRRLPWTDRPAAAALLEAPRIFRTAFLGINLCCELSVQVLVVDL